MMLIKTTCRLLSTTALILGVLTAPLYSMQSSPQQDLQTQVTTLFGPNSPLKGGVRKKSINTAYTQLQQKNLNHDPIAKEVLNEYSDTSDDGKEEALKEYYKALNPRKKGTTSPPAAHGASNGIPGNLTSMTLLELKNLYQRAHSASKEPNMDTSQWLPQQFIKEIERLIDVLARKGIALSGPVVGGVGPGPKQMDADKLTIPELQAAMDEISTKQLELYNKNPNDPEIDILQARYEELEKFLKLRTAEYEKAEAKKAADIKNAAERERIRLETEAKKAVDEKLYQTIVNNPKFQIPALPTDKERIDFLGVPATSLEFLISAPENLFLQIMENFKLSKGIAQKIDVEANADILSALLYKIHLIKSYPAKTKNSYELLTSSLNNQLSKLGKGSVVFLAKPKGVSTTPEEEQNYQDLLAYYAQKNLNPQYIQQVKNSSVPITALSVILFPNKPKGAHTYQTVFNSIDKSLTPFEWRGVRAAIKKGEIQLELNYLEIAKLVNKIDEIIKSIENGTTELNKSGAERYKSQQNWILAGRPNSAVPPPPAVVAAHANAPVAAAVQVKILDPNSNGVKIQAALQKQGIDVAIANEVGQKINQLKEPNINKMTNATIVILQKHKKIASPKDLKDIIEQQSEYKNMVTAALE